MTPEIFTTWLRSYADDIDDTPSAEQWKHIKEVLAAVEPTVVLVVEKESLSKSVANAQPLPFK